MKRLLISFSGGETSAYMTKLLLSKKEEYKEVVVVFANTGQENEETLEFVHKCDEFFGFNTVWIEAVVNHGIRKSCSHRIVTFESCSRSGEPFEDVIKKYGIPNSKFKHCTRNLKLEPIRSYARSIGWDTYYTAVGIRADEMDRVSSSAKENRIIYPLCGEYPTTKKDINSFWKDMPFRLQLKGYQGNCKWCWKKSDRKLFTIMMENPESFDFPDRMENLYGTCGNRPNMPKGYSATFFRANRSTKDLIKIVNELGDDFKPADDDSIVFNPEIDVGGGCEESCEVFSDEDMQLKLDI